MELINCKVISDKKRKEIREKIDKIKNKITIPPGLATILVGNDQASQTYIASKIKACESVGIKSFHYNLAENSSKKIIINLINKLNKNQEVDGILLQLPIPQSKDEQDCINSIDPLKDVDGLHPLNVGALNLSKHWNEIIEKNTLVSCTPLGIMKVLFESNIEVEGKTIVIIGRSNLVGKPLSMLMLSKNATVIITHSKTKNLEKICKSADIIIAAIGKPNFINKEFIKNNSIIIDVGINKVSGKIYGDVNLESIKNMNVKITPVPGGIGLMTITALLENTIKAFYNRRNKQQSN
ncbi:MAG: bifunctional 5,10-methylenetetrahydrofolate dehydrogenase/5,10-methenyltetrahydrofolate cyclohydrolase [Endomicrobium sp.]|jgi:methylenetetrahydrofolate dehydrogenase (NADP+)/methenyltetrahydrofolate cyclohydrolase|nr:bifunctional 5,10-methylenetetrahydrofolate dehydrogenase/5,10-methenyltetrahydrofolate cyclohydrolase [Endomicrobium sp.]